MKTYTDLEITYIALCKTVESKLARIVELATGQHIDEAGQAAASLLEYVENKRQAYEIQEWQLVLPMEM